MRSHSLVMALELGIGPREKSREKQYQSIVLVLSGTRPRGVGRARAQGLLRDAVAVPDVQNSGAGLDGLGIPWETALLASGRAGAGPVLQTLITTRCHRHCFPRFGSAPPCGEHPLPGRGHAVLRGDTSAGLYGALGESRWGEGVRGCWCPDSGGGRQVVLTFSPVCPEDTTASALCLLTEHLVIE